MNPSTLYSSEALKISYNLWPLYDNLYDFMNHIIGSEINENKDILLKHYIYDTTSDFFYLSSVWYKDKPTMIIISEHGIIDNIITDMDSFRELLEYIKYIFNCSTEIPIANYNQYPVSKHHPSLEKFNGKNISDYYVINPLETIYKEGQIVKANIEIPFSLNKKIENNCIITKVNRFSKKQTYHLISEDQQFNEVYTPLFAREEDIEETIGFSLHHLFRAE